MNGRGLMSKAHAFGDVQKMAICNESGNKCAYVSRNQALEVSSD